MSAFGESKDLIQATAFAWWKAGCNVIPPAQDGTKKPSGTWRHLIKDRQTQQELDQFYSVARDGVGLVCGPVSGNLEMMELEGRATHSLALDAILFETQARGVDWLWQLLLSNGYAEWTPSGGLHFLYRVKDHDVPGNTKIARRPATEEELAANPGDKIKTLAETRGEGGYVIVAPTAGNVHPSKQAWTLAAGAPGQLAAISWEDRCKLHEAIHAALDEMPPEPEFSRPALPTRSIGPSDSSRPGDDFNTRATWEEILQPHGWQIHHQTLQETFWTRPGKHKRDGWSATTGYSASGDRLYVWSSSTNFTPEQPYTKFAAWTLLEHHGDFAAAARALSQQGYGQRAATSSPYVASPMPTATVGAEVVPVRVQETPSEDVGGQQPPQPMTRERTRQRVVVSGDRWEVRQELTSQLIKNWDGDTLFNYGDVICRRDGTGMIPMTKEMLDDVIARTCITETMKPDRRKDHEGEYVYSHALPEARVLGMILSDPKRFSKLDKLGQVPFVRPDGTICATPGYDQETRTFLELDGELEGIQIPEMPSSEQINTARDLLLNELLEGFPFHTEADRDNALGTLLTPFIRDLIPTSPLGVIDAKEAGSGKNLLGDIVSILMTGKAAQTLPYTGDDVEQRKVITSAFRSGVPLLLFDEAHHVEGASFARALTSHTYQDRVLGASNLAEYPNNRTWLSLGNQVQVTGDMARRVYRIRLEYPGASPEDRPASDFRHPDLRAWATENRRELVTACLTLIRAWFAQGKPSVKLAFRMGSFERWQEILTGILSVAGRDSFLANTKGWRAETDFERQHLVAHLGWLRETFGDKEFTAGEVTKALQWQRDAERPPGMDDPSQEGYGRRLGQFFGRTKDRILDGYKLAKGETFGHAKVAKWRIEYVETGDDSDPST